MKKKSTDLTIDGPYSPVSLKKFLEHEKENPPQQLKILVDRTGLGIAMDDPQIIVIDSEERLKQAAYFRDKIFDGKKLPPYLFRHLYYMFELGEDNKYPDNDSVLRAFRSGELNFDSEEYKAVVNLIKYSSHNIEAGQLIGFIQLFAGSMHMAKKEGACVRLLISYPETNLHPKRAARFMSLFYTLIDEYKIPHDQVSD